MEKDNNLQENTKIEEAIEQLQKVPSQEMLTHTLTVLRRRMKEDGELIPSVDQDAGTGSLQMRLLKTKDGRSWFLAFTSFEEQMKDSNPVMSAFTAKISQLFQMVLEEEKIDGLILNPWNRTIMLDKNLIRIIIGENGR
ncbi:MAG: SseB family protein [Lachnospiraceae bacterium]|nr:SseB family protein [Lachnospiraceae bacterium]MDD7078082.1 SseB family protein [Lachnospiraceae bacterium]MDY3729599.1 SseB family protein [Candidatus Choladocola sp.]